MTVSNTQPHPSFEVVGPKTTTATRPTKALPQYMIDEGRTSERVSFDPAKHLNIVHPEKIYSMKDLALDGFGISTTAASVPFSLFTPEAVKQMRAELFSAPVLESCQYASDFATNMIRGFGPSLAPFIFDAWNSPEVLAAVSRIAGVDLVPAVDFDVGHVNISVNNQNGDKAQTDSEIIKENMEAFSWHRDSYPFVCVTMLSDCTDMIGGETALRTGNGDVMKIRGPAMGTAVVMQGRYIEHQALKALGGRERISMVTSFRPRSPLVKDETILTGVRGISTLPELYGQYTEYRLEVLEERVRQVLKGIRNRQCYQRSFDVTSARKFLTEQRDYLDAMLTELVV